MCQGENSFFRPNFHVFLHNSVTHEYIFLPKKIWNFFRKSSHPNDHVCCRECLGADLVIILLTMSSADRRERVLARHSDDVQAADLMDVSNDWIFDIFPIILFSAFWKPDGRSSGEWTKHYWAESWQHNDKRWSCCQDIWENRETVFLMYKFNS